MDELLIEKYALNNALKYEGKANPGNIIGQIVREKPEVKSQMKELQQLAGAVVARVNSMSVEQQRARLEELAPELLEKKEHKEHDLFAFLNIAADTSVTTGFPPEPSKYLHIGHAKAILANSELAARYNGKFILRFDDTNPTVPKKEFYELIVNDIEWLGVHPAKVDIASDRIPQLYEQAEKLIDAGHCFVCDCPGELVNEQRYKGEADKHRDQPLEETKQRWANLKEGEVLRLRIKPDHKNSTMRDPTIFRVMHEPHPMTGDKYHIYPTYDFETCLLDSFENITHRLRTKEFELRNELHNYIQKLAGFPLTTYYEFGRFSLEGVDTSGRVVREKISKGEYVGWDDPSLATLVALRRRGFTPQAIKSFVLSTGLTKNDATLTWDDLYVHNRRVLNETAKRLFFVEEPQRVTIAGSPGKQLELHHFPHDKRGERTFATMDTFYIAADDMQQLREGELYRLMDCVNFTKKGETFVFHSEDIDEYREKGRRIMHFLPAEHEAVPVEILMPDKTIKKGLGESRVKQLQVGDVIQFERFGFCRFDAVENNVYKFWFTHK